MDFAENYSFHMLDETQGYHWAQQSCKVFRVVCYYRVQLKWAQSPKLCFLSEELKH